VEGEFVQLAAPIDEAVAFAMGWIDCGYAAPTAAMRRIVGELAVDRLQYAEEWRIAAMLRECIRRPGLADAEPED
jgi:hypothetical protein